MTEGYRRLKAAKDTDSSAQKPGGQYLFICAAVYISLTISQMTLKNKHKVANREAITLELYIASLSTKAPKLS